MRLPAIPNFLRENTQFVYSLLLIILIPSALAFNTWWNLRAFDRDINFELRREADLVGGIFGALLAQNLGDKELLEESIDQIKQNNPEILSLTVLEPSADGFDILFSDRQVGAENVSVVLNNLAWSQERSFASLILDSQTQGRAWIVATPIKNADGEKIGIADVRISTKTMEELAVRTARDSIIILGATIFLILLLLLNHLRFFEYSILYAKLQEINRLKDEFISAAAHDLKNPIAAIKGYSLLLSENPKVRKDKDLKETVNTLREITWNLEKLVRELLEVTRIEGGRISLDLQKTSLKDVADELVAQFKIEAENKKVKLSYKPYRGLPKVKVDGVRIREVFSNLISNAIKYTPEGGEVVVEHDVERGKVRTWVKDNGIGIPADEMSKLFTKFGRIRTEENKDIPGTGLGLWINKQLIERMGGRIYVESIEGEGSKFTVVLPAVR